MELLEMVIAQVGTNTPNIDDKRRSLGSIGLPEDLHAKSRPHLKLEAPGKKTEASRTEVTAVIGRSRQQDKGILRRPRDRGYYIRP